MAAHSSILTWEIKGQRSPVGNSPRGRKRVGHDWAAKQQKRRDERLTGFAREARARPAWLPALPLARCHPLPVSLCSVSSQLSPGATCVRARCRFIVSDSETPWTVARQSPLSMGFSRQEFRGGLPCPPAGDLPDPGIKLTPPALEVDSLPPSYQGSPPAPTLRIPSERRDITWSLPD